MDHPPTPKLTQMPFLPKTNCVKNVHAVQIIPIPVKLSQMPFLPNANCVKNVHAVPVTPIQSVPANRMYSSVAVHAVCHFASLKTDVCKKGVMIHRIPQPNISPGRRGSAVWTPHATGIPQYLSTQRRRKLVSPRQFVPLTTRGRQGSIVERGKRPFCLPALTKMAPSLFKMATAGITCHNNIRQWNTGHREMMQDLGLPTHRPKRSLSTNMAARSVVLKYNGRVRAPRSARRGAFATPTSLSTFPIPTLPSAPATPIARTRSDARVTSTGIPTDARTMGTSPARVTSLPPNPLAQCLEQWKRCNPGAWIQRTITRGYKLQFSSKPPMSDKVLYTHASGQAAVILRQEIISLLNKGAIQEVTSKQNRLGFYSRYFLVEKKGGGMRPILDLRGLNKFLKTFKFRMLTTASLLRTVRRGDWFTSLDLKDAYQHVAVYAPHRKFLRFGFEGRVYEYTVLPFGMSLSPRVFVKCTQAAIAPLRLQGIRLATYIDDWLISADTSEMVNQHTKVVSDHLVSLGFTLNLEKSVLVPSQQTTFIGIALDSTTLTARLSQDRICNFLSCVRSFRLGERVTYKTCMQAAGLMASALHLIRLGRLHMRPFQEWLHSLRIPATRGWRKVQVSEGCVRALRPWTDVDFLSQGVKVGLVISWKVITTDASLTGWGGTHEGRFVRGLWDDDLKTAHINYLELMAVLLALKHFEPLIRGYHVLIRTDNTAALYYINKQGGLASPKLNQLARDLTLWCDSRLASIRASHVPGLQNSGADLLSRGKVWYADWSLHPQVASQIWGRFGHPVVDLFASQENTKCPLFFSVRGKAPLGLDAFAHTWPGSLLYAFPPLELILPTLERIRLQGLTVLLVAPGWGTWTSVITPLLYDAPWPLPLRRDLLRQAKGEIFHPRPQDLDLRVWPVRGPI